MGWIDPVVSYASPPRLTAPEPRDVGTATFDDASDSRWECVDRAMTASVIDLDGCDVLEIENSTLDGVTFMGRTMPRSTLVHSVLVGCDLSGARFDSLRNVRFADCKLVGADFAGAEVLDVSFHGCVLRIVNLRMAKLRRVEFVDCTLHDVDAHGLEAEDVSFVGSDLERVNIDRMRARRVDLRRCRCPPERLLPPVLTNVFICIGIATISSASPAARAASHASSWVMSPPAAMFSKMLPAMIILCCKTVPIWRRTAVTSRRERS
jgi:hypothetical protein